MSNTYKVVEGKVVLVGHKPILGAQLMVVSATPRSYRENDWWKCSPIKEILVDEGDYVKFRTTTSIYEWWKE